MMMTVIGHLQTGRPLLLFLGLLTSSVGCADHIKRGDQYLAEGKPREAIIEYLTVIQKDANNREATVRLGPVLFDTGQFGPALTYLQKGVEFEPDNLDLRVKLGTIYLLSGSLEQARDEASAVLEHDPKNLDALTIFANTASTEGEVDGAIRRLENSRADNENRAKFHLALGTLYLRKRDAKAAEDAFQEAARREPNSPEAHLGLGGFYLVTHQPAAAKEEFDKAAEAAPPRSGIQIRVVDLYRLLGQPDEGDRHLDQLVKEAPDFYPAWGRIAQYAFTDKKYDRSQEALTHLLEANPKNPDALRLMGEVLQAKGETEEAEKRFREAITVYQDLVNRRPNVPALHYRLAQMHVRVGEMTQARTQLQKLIELAPNSSGAILMLAELDVNTGEQKSAIGPLEELISRQPSPIAYDLLGRAYLQEREFPKAAAAFEKYAEMAPRQARAHHFLGASLAGEGKLKEAVIELEEALRLDPKYVEPLALIATIDARQQRLGAALARVRRQIDKIEPTGRHEFLLGQFYMASNQLDNALTAYQKAVEIDPNLSAAYAQLSAIYVRIGQTEKALAELEKGLQRNPENVSVMMLKGMLQQQKGAVETAQLTYEELLGINPKFAPAANNLAYIYQEHGKLDEALRLAEVARTEAPDNPDIADTLGWILYKRGTYDRALSLLKEAASKKPDNPEILFHLGFTHNKLGEFEDTARVLKEALKLDPKSQMAVEAQTILDELH